MNPKKIIIKRQNSLHLFINCKSNIEKQICSNMNIVTKSHKTSLNLPYAGIQFNENKETNIKKRKASYQSKIILKPIVKDKFEVSKKDSNVPNNPVLPVINKNKLKQKIKHSSKSGVTIPFYMKYRLQKEKIMCINKENKNINSDKDLTAYCNEDKEKYNIQNKLCEKEKKINIVYNSENFISLTQKGFFLNKNIERENNQDCSLILENVCGIKNFNIYSIMDGHGSNGHLVSNFIKEKIIQNFTDISFYFKKIKQKDSTPLEYPENILELILKKLKKNDFQKIKDFYKTIDESLSSIEVRFDSNFSGSTCIMIFQLGNYLISSNVGDSRSLLIKENKEIIELSKDQKPENENEKQRIESMGGIVSQCNDLYDDGKEGGPFRVWMKGCDYPGIAMSRSIGDKIAHSIGVINEPEILEFNLDENSKYIILGSDGIWQFLKNEDIINIIFEKNQKEKQKNNSKEIICKKIIKEAVKNFIENDEYVDDITISLVSINKSLL